MAAHECALVGDLEDLFWGEVRRLKAGRWLGKGAVTAAVLAQHGEGNENFWAKSNAIPELFLAALTG